MPSQTSTSSPAPRPDEIWRMSEESCAKAASIARLSTKTVARAKNYYDRPLIRGILEGLLIADLSDEDIIKITGIDAKTLKAYKKVFFNPKAFLNRLDKLAYVDSLKGLDADLYHTLLIALRNGVDYIKWLLNGSPVRVDPLNDAAILLRGLKTNSIDIENAIKLYRAVVAQAPSQDVDDDVEFLIAGVNDERSGDT